MKKLCVFTTLFFVFKFTGVQSQYIALNKSDSLAFVDIYHKTNGLNWSQQIDFSRRADQWPFIVKVNSRIVVINLENNNLVGNLAATGIGKLTALERLNLSNNQLTGVLPTSIGNLTSLNELLLSNNLFTGGVPSSYGKLSALVTLRIDHNHLDGKVPAAFFTNLLSLKTVRMEYNQLGGWIPSSIGSAVQLETADFSYNRFTNKIPASVNTLPKLYRFSVAYNQLHGDNAGRFCLGGILDVRGNKYDFDFLECLSYNWDVTINPQQAVPLKRDSTVLTVVTGGNSAEKIYKWYRNDGTTPYLVEHHKHFEPGKYSRLEIVESGTYWVTAESSYLVDFFISSDTITVPALNGLLARDSMALVDLFNSSNGVQWTNKLNWLTNAPLNSWHGVELINGRVGNVNLANNNLIGNLPTTIKNLTGAKNIDVSNNQLSGLLPNLSGALRLNTINLSGNRFRGGIPAGWTKLINLTSIDLSNNIISGSIPSNFGNLNKLQYLNLSYNRLSGLIPESVGALTLTEARYDHNQLTGPVPTSFCTGNTVINISYNLFNFTGMECVENTGRILYNNQAKLDILDPSGIYKVAAGGNLSDNTYMWYQDGTLVTTRSGDSTFLPNKPGNYYASVSNRNAPDLILGTDTVSYSFPGSLTSDSLALVDFYQNITAGLNWVLTSPMETWEGVTIEFGRVTKLQLTGLAGKLNASLGNLSALIELEIYDGNITDSIPESITRLTQLTRIYLELKGETGQIPDDLGRYQPFLEWVMLPSNKHTGPIPSGLRFTKKLIGLNLVDNRLTGTIPDFFKDISVVSLGLSLNRLTGKIPDTLSNNISGVELANNQLTGSIPSWLATRNLGLIDLANNQLTGQLPDSMSYKWKIVRLQHNQLSGTIPEITAMPVEIDLSYNNFEAVSTTLCQTNFKMPDIINFSYNRLNFSNIECVPSNSYLTHINIAPQQNIPFIDDNPLLKIPAGGTPGNNTFKWYKNDTLIATIAADSTYIASTPGTYHAVVNNAQLPDLTLYTDTLYLINKESRSKDSLALVEISKYLSFQSWWDFYKPIDTWEGVTVVNGRVTELYLYYADGTISPAIGDLTALRSIYIYGDTEYNNTISGPLPATLANLPEIETLSIEMFSDDGGPVPDDIGKNQPNLVWLRFPGNKHSGNIPSGLRYAKNLQYLDFEGNQFTGTVPDFFKELNLTTIDLYGSNLVGTIPDTLSRRSDMSIVNFGNNNLTGTIPPWLANTSISFVDLSNNQLTGQLPDSMSFKWGAILMQNNQFDGTLPGLSGTETSWYNVSGNNLDAIPPSLCDVNFIRDERLDLTNNRFNFTNLECASPEPIRRLMLQPQKNIHLLQQINLLLAPAGGTASNNTYKWYRGNVLTATITGDSTYEVQLTGSYHVNVTNSMVPGLTLTSDTVVFTALSERSRGAVSDAKNFGDGKLRLYPNPSSGFVRIGGLVRPSLISIHDASGKLVKRWEAVLANQPLDISNLKKGLYVVTIHQSTAPAVLKFLKD